MLNVSNIRALGALLFSLVVHAMLLGIETGSQSTARIVAVKKVTMRLVSRPVKNVAPSPQSLPDKKFINKIQPDIARQPIITEPVQVAVKEIPAPVMPSVPTVEPLMSEGDPGEHDISNDAAEVVLARPLYRENPPPRYPALARRRHQQGTALLAVMVSGDGKVLELDLEKSSGYQVLDQAAMEAVSFWVFEPGRRGGMPTAMKVLVPVKFTLK